jgi:NAD(P)-dependent dehydrogenase (short-subunit alcohol dehydrogenase family)
MTPSVLVTGGASGFGQALAAIYAARGANVLVTDLADEVPEHTLPPATGSGEVRYLRLDVRDATGWEKVRGWVEEHWGGLDLLVNNAGVAAGGRVDVVPLEDWEWIVDINLLGVVRGCRAFTPMFKRQRSGRIVNVASMAGLVHPPAMSAYNAVKAGVVALSETMLHELDAYDVGVSVVCASFFRTNLADSLRSSDPPLTESARRLMTGSKLDASTIAARAVRGIDAGRFLILTHRDARAVYLVKRLSPALYHRAMKRAGRRLAERVEDAG